MGDGLFKVEDTIRLLKKLNRKCFMLRKDDKVGMMPIYDRRYASPWQYNNEIEKIKISRSKANYLR